jgi:hypothetical protein
MRIVATAANFARARRGANTPIDAGRCRSQKLLISFNKSWLATQC